MTDATRFQFNNPSVPKAYNEFFVPRLFEPWAKVLLEGADLRRGESVLDVATGPGTVARLAAVRLGAEGRVVATDIAQPMLDIAKAKAPPGGAPIEYLNSPAAPLAAATGAFDAVLCQQGLQFFPDRPAALREMRRVLKPGGRAAIAVWAELDRNQIFAAFHAALRATAPDALADLITAPFSWPSGAALKSAAEDTGFRDVRLSTPSLPMVLEGGVEQAVHLRRDAGVPRRCRACARRPAGSLRPYAARNGAAIDGWEGRRRDDVQHHRRPLLTTRAGATRACALAESAAPQFVGAMLASFASLRIAATSSR
jgi:ubiquinone/menaquinone biosynthesis C-methylase UbiE